MYYMENKGRFFQTECFVLKNFKTISDDELLQTLKLIKLTSYPRHLLRYLRRGVPRLCCSTKASY